MPGESIDVAHLQHSISNSPPPSSSFTELLSTSGSPRPATTINSLPGDVLLEIFDIYRMDEIITSSHLPWKWHRLAHVCRTWRDVIFSSSRHLNLELLCTHGTPVRKCLGDLPALPIVVHFPNSFKDNDEDNILAALEHPDRVRVIVLRVPCSLPEKMATVTQWQGPFPALIRLSLESKLDGIMPILPGTFLGGGVPRLQRICLDGIPFPTAPTLLFSARDLVNVNLREIPDTGYVSPEAVVTSLAALSGLKYLTLGFRWGPSSSNPRRLPTTRTILPALTRFYFEGFFEYLEHFVAQIDAPQLDCLGIDYLEYWDEEEIADYQIPQLCKFVDRSEKLKLSWFRRMELRIQLNTVSIEFVHGDQPSFQLSIQDEGITQVLGQICGTLSNVDCLFIGSGRTEPDELLGDDIEWLQLLRTLTAVKALCVQDELSHHVALALEHVTWEPERAAEVLPALELLCLQDWPVASVEKFVAARRNVGCPVTFVKTVRELQDRLEFNVGELANVPYYSVIPDIMQ